MDAVPRHLAIIPDGNRRWAKIHNKSMLKAYEVGIRKAWEVAKWCRDADVDILSFWALSTENLKRSKEEIATLFHLFERHLVRAAESREVEENKVSVNFFGRLNLIPEKLRSMMDEISRKRKFGRYTVNFFIGYGGRKEIIDAVNSIINSGVRSVDEREFERHLYTSGIPDPDLVIRTSGRFRTSGFMPWQTCYSEFFFCDKLWPEFSFGDFQSALKDYSCRVRNFGK